ncbi:YggT family protein [Clostridium septicum]|uniref:YggT family protein n=1 Tax=Clostridium septicum TaxID=1504 RepID=UPI001D158619|nr:YggT family protein [Clostridium septicum]MDU1313214.1 YggT family protein [Clostridium septicum]UEC22301.1 YggT family protein [Clostridium septicum]WLF71062.1 YggT family protein [Clostridium septicum]
MVNLLVRLLEFTILAEVLLSWIPGMRENKIYELIVTFNNPIIEPFRRIQQNIFSNSMIDFSPMFALIFINILRSIIFTVLPL